MSKTLTVIALVVGLLAGFFVGTSHFGRRLVVGAAMNVRGDPYPDGRMGVVMSDPKDIAPAANALLAAAGTVASKTSPAPALAGSFYYPIMYQCNTSLANCAEVVYQDSSEDTQFLCLNTHTKTIISPCP